MSGYIGNIPTPQATQTRETFTATASQTTFNTAGYTPGFVDVWLNGVKLVNGDDFTATNGSDVVLTVGAASGDTVEVLSFSTFEVNSQTFTGGLTVNNDGATVITADRATSDGSIVDFKKDGTSVGSIGNRGVNLEIASPSNIEFNADTSDANRTIYFDGNQFGPFLADDASVDFGMSNRRWKDLYLSGGVYLGGTGAANLLDDYEEGTWTPTLPNGGTISTIESARYTKVGRVVNLNFYLSGINPTANTAQFRIGGLPFAAENAANSYFGGTFGYGGDANSGPLLPITGANLSIIYFHRNDNNAASLTNNDIRTLGWVGAVADDMVISITYFTNS